MLSGHLVEVALLGMFALVWVLMTASARCRLSRGDFAWRVLAGLVAISLAGLLIGAHEAIAATGGLRSWLVITLALITYAAYAIALPRWTAQRLIDVGVSKWFTLVGLIPAVLLVMVLLLLFWPAAKPRESARTAEAFDRAWRAATTGD